MVATLAMVVIPSIAMAAPVENVGPASMNVASAATDTWGGTATLSEEDVQADPANAEASAGGVTLQAEVNYDTSTYQYSGRTWKDAPESVKAKGIDVSAWQGSYIGTSIDWDAVKADGVDFAIIRVGFRGSFGGSRKLYADPDGLYNMEECERVGIPYGVYFYSAASDADEALEEAKLAVSLLEGRSLSYPVYLDLEEEAMAGENDTLAEIATTFCDYVSAHGYQPGVYASNYWWASYLTDDCFDGWDKWVASYLYARTDGSKPVLSSVVRGEYGIWQTTSRGVVDGIVGEVDMDYDFKGASNGETPDPEPVVRTISFDANGGVGTMDDVQKVDGTDLTLPANAFTRDGYTFAGWNTAADGSGTAYVDAATISDYTATLYAQWEKSEPEPEPEPAPAPVSFPDVEDGAWYVEGVDYCSATGIMTGYDNGYFGVGDPLTRAQFATMLWRIAEPEAAAAYDASIAVNETGLSDVQSGMYYTAAANWAVRNGIITGYENPDGSRTFAPYDLLTTEQMATILARYVGGIEVASANANALESFADGGTVSGWARQSVAWAKEAGILAGYDNADGTRTLGPQEYIARERAATIVMRTFQE